MRMDGFEPGVATPSHRAEGGEAAEGVDLEHAETELLDEWILSRLQTVEAEMTEAFEDFEQDKALNALLDFVVEDVSRFYVQEVRERMWEEGDSASKTAAYATLYTVLEEVVALFAPFAPFISEEIYQNLTGDAGHDTVHMCDWPGPDEFWQDEALEEDVAVVRAVEEAGSNARQQAGRSLRWPVTRIVLDVTDGEDLAAVLDERADLLAERLNARAVEVVDPDEQWGEISYSAEADMSLLGPEFGDDASAVMNALNEARVTEPTLDALERVVEDAVEGNIELTGEMVEFVRHTPEGISGVEFEALDGAGVAYVDTTLTEDIESEGYAREVIRRVQEMRKDLDLEMDARIRVELDVADDRVADLVAQHEDLIAEEVRADEFGSVEDGHRKEWDVEETTMTITVEPLAAPET